ncbi:MAG: hypothetical protein ABEJ46_05565 [Gemmatimonadota bacterium]
MIGVTGAEVGTRYAPARPGELQRSALDAGRLEAAGWSPERRLAEGLRETVQHIEECE